MMCTKWQQNGAAWALAMREAGYTLSCVERRGTSTSIVRVCMPDVRGCAEYLPPTPSTIQPSMGLYMSMPKGSMTGHRRSDETYG